MANRPLLTPYQVITAGSMAGNLTSTPTILQQLSMVSYALSWTGTSPVGTVSIQGSNDYALTPSGTVKNAGTWTTMTVSYNGAATTAIPISGNTGTGIIDVTLTSIYAIRLIYTAGSGTGSLTATVSGKVS